MKIALVQMECKVGEIEANVAAMVREIDAAAEQGADLVIFPEMSDTGYDMAAIGRCAQPADGLPRRLLSEAARRRGIHVIAGLSLHEPDGRIFNTAVAFDRSGAVAGEYRKIHLFSGEPIREQVFLQRGSQRTLVTIDGWNVGLMICYDLRFPEMARSLLLDGADAIVLVSAWPAARIAHWRALAVARALENLCVVAAVNRVGFDSGVELGGGSLLIGPMGAVAAECGSTAMTTICDIADGGVREARATFPWLNDRRVSTYRL